MKKFEVLGVAFAAFSIAVLAAVLLGLPLMWLWNWLMPVIFKLPEITFLQAVGLNVLSSILFKTTASIKN